MSGQLLGGHVRMIYVGVGDWLLFFPWVPLPVFTFLYRILRCESILEEYNFVTIVFFYFFIFFYQNFDALFILFVFNLNRIYIE